MAFRFPSLSGQQQRESHPRQPNHSSQKVQHLINPQELQIHEHEQLNRYRKNNTNPQTIQNSEVAENTISCESVIRKRGTPAKLDITKSGEILNC